MNGGRVASTNSFHEMKFSSFNFRLRSIISSIEPRLSVWAVSHSLGEKNNFSPRHTLHANYPPTSSPIIVMFGN